MEYSMRTYRGIHSRRQLASPCHPRSLPRHPAPRVPSPLTSSAAGVMPSPGFLLGLHAYPHGELSTHPVTLPPCHPRPTEYSIRIYRSTTYAANNNDESTYAPPSPPPKQSSLHPLPLEYSLLIEGSAYVFPNPTPTDLDPLPIPAFCANSE